VLIAAGREGRRSASSSRFECTYLITNSTGDKVTVLIRDYASSDRDDVNRVALAAFSQYGQHYEDWATFQEGIGRMADLASDAELVVAERVGVVVGGVVHVGPGSPRNSIFPDDWSVIRMLVVDPHERGQGIGKRLVGACLERALRAVAPIIGLHTSPIMEHALSLYTSIGFERDCDLPAIKGVPYARYVLLQAAIPAALELLKER
jgi:ribosomal protein S18 acetylase RimI-like enzyme